MSTSENFLVQVETYQLTQLVYLNNFCPIINRGNKKFSQFNQLKAQLGSSVNLELPPRMTFGNSLTTPMLQTAQRYIPLTINQQFSSPFAFTEQEMILNINPNDYMARFGKNAMQVLGTQVEQYLAKDFIKYPYRFFGNGVQSLNSFGLLMEAEAYFKEYGTTQGEVNAFLPNMSIPQIINSGWSQFTPERNNETAMSWDLGGIKGSNVRWYRSNLLAKHFAGTEGNEGSTLTVVSVVQDSLGNITQITFSGTNSASDVNSIKAYDRFQFLDNVGSYPNLRFLNFTGDHVSDCYVQFQSASNASSTSGSQVTVTLVTPLYVGVSQTNNPGINASIVPGMQCKVLPSHQVGCMYADNAHYVSVPQLPNYIPYPTANKVDPKTGLTMQTYWGSVFNGNQQGMVNNLIMGSCLPPEYSMALIEPLNSNTNLF